MKRIEGVWLTDGEEHLLPHLNKGQGKYQFQTLEQSVKNTPKHRLVIDVGAHVGLWSMHLANRFQRVISFEPVPEHRDCFAKNVLQKNVTLYPFALGKENKMVTLDWDPANTGHTHVGKGTISVQMKRLDDLNLTGVDLLKIDTEGYEIYVLQGAEKMLLREKPIVCIEQKPHGYYGENQLAGVQYLQSLGAVVLERVVDDFIMGWPSPQQSLSMPKLDAPLPLRRQLRSFFRNLIGKLRGKKRVA